MVTDGDSYMFEDAESDEPNAAIFSKTDLTINGSGSLTVKANYNDGITSKDDLKIVSGDITVDAANDAIKGKDCLGIKEATVTVTAGGDGHAGQQRHRGRQGFRLHLGRRHRHHRRARTASRRRPTLLVARRRPHDCDRWR